IVNPIQAASNTIVTVSTASVPGVGFSSQSNTSLADPLRFESRLELDVWDVEATQDWQAGSWSVLAAGGVRGVHLRQQDNGLRSRTGTFTTDPGTRVLFSTDADVLVSHRDFDGLGPVAALELHRPLGGKGLALYGNVRGAVLFGSGRQHASG